MPDEIDELRREIRVLREELRSALDVDERSYYFSKAPLVGDESATGIPHMGMPADAARSLIEDHHAVDFNQKLTTSSYVNVEFEEDEAAIALMGLQVNLADQTVYPESYKLHDSVVNMVARLWHCPEPEDLEEFGVFAGAGTVGSTEA